MNPTLRRVIAAGLGSLAMTEKAVRRLIDDLVSKGEITRSDGERILVDLERKWGEEATQLGQTWDRARQDVEQMVTSAVSKTLDRMGLARKSEIEAIKRRMDDREARRARSSVASARGGTRRKGVTPASGKDKSS